MSDPDHKDRLARVRSRRKQATPRPDKPRRVRAPRPVHTEPEPVEVGGRVRLHKFLADAGVASRRSCEELITSGRVEVDGQVITTLGATIDPSSQTVRFDGETVRPESKVYWWVYKPPGVLCTNEDTHGRRTVLEMIPSLKSRVYAVGRLDLEGTGLLLLTNDGPLAYRLTHPRFGVSQGFELLVAGRVSGETLAQIRRGVWLSEGKFRPSFIRPLGMQGNATVLSVQAGEGGHHLLRRGFAKLGHKVLKLERVSIGPIKIRHLRLGQARLATEVEVQMLRDLTKRSDSQNEEAPRERPVAPRRPPAPRSGVHRPAGRRDQSNEARGSKPRGPRKPTAKPRRRP